MRRRRGMTLIEVLTALAIGGIVAIALSGSLAQGVRASAEFEQPRLRYEASIRFEDDVRSLLEKAFVASEATDAPSYFITQSTGSSVIGQGADTITFTVLGERPGGAALSSDEEEFETRNETFGAQGGTEEVSISLTAVGDSGGRSGLFLRKQRPADADTDQGGFEQVLASDVQAIGFEFWNGTEWVVEWNSQGTEAQQLPYAVRVSYQLEGDEAIKSFVVRLPNGYVEETGEEAQ